MYSVLTLVRSSDALHVTMARKMKSSYGIFADTRSCCLRYPRNNHCVGQDLSPNGKERFDGSVCQDAMTSVSKYRLSPLHI